MSAAAYSMTTKAVGHGDDKWIVRAVRVPREDFLEIVEYCLTRWPVPDPDGLRKVAQEMPHFPFGEWVHRDRGCGCLVGEYLIAADELKREDVMAGVVSIVELIGGKPVLEGFGLQVDAKLRARVQLEGVSYSQTMPQVAVFV